MKFTEYMTIVAHNRRHHLYYTAEAYLAVGLLQAFITNVFVDKKRVAWKMLSCLEGVSDKIKRFGNYSNSNISDHVIVARRSTFMRLLFSLLCGNTRGGGWSDVVVEMAIRKRSIVHLPCVHAEESFSKVKGKVPGLVLEQYIAERGYGRQVLLEEVENLGVSDAKIVDRLGLSEEKVRANKAECILADRIVAGSAFVKETLIKGGVSGEKIILAHYGVDADKWPYVRMRRSAGEPLRVAFVGSGAVRKGLFYLLKACGGKKEVVVHVFGWCKDLPRSKYTNAKNIVFHGHIPQGDLVHEMARCHVFVLPSLMEGSALVVGEAMAMGMPVIVTPNAGSWARDGIDGFIVPIRDSMAIWSAIDELLDEDRRIEMGRNARVNAEAHTWLRYQRQLLAGLNIKGIGDSFREEEC